MYQMVLQNLNNKTPITDPRTGIPTPYFIRDLRTSFQDTLNLVTMLASEDIPDGNFVAFNIVSGSVRACNATCTDPNKYAQGYAYQGGLAGDTITIRLVGENDSVSNLTMGVQYLSNTPGKATNTPSLNPGNVIQILGYASSQTSIIFNPSPPITLA
jgi:hypothetical protein